MGKNMALKAALEHVQQIKFEVEARYTILETIGNGAYGVVCSAFDNKTRKKVAIKKISRIFDIPTIAKRTLRELKILKYLNHDNIISIKDILHPPEDLSKFQDVYVVLDLMESDLHHIIYSNQILSEDHVRYFLYQILCGLKYIHSAKFLHRDLKPSNLLVNGNCELKIGDFGMARSLDSSPTEQKRVMTEYVQTRWYRAPELMLSVHQFNTGIDMWSVGCIFAEMLARRPLFPGANYLNQLQLILSVVGLPKEDFLSKSTSERVRQYISKLPHKDPVQLNTLFPSASNQVIDLLSKFLKLDPDERCSAEEALSSPFLSMYHNLDDEPTCSPMKFDFDAIPLEKNALKAAILNEILHFNIQDKGVLLTPVSPKFVSQGMDRPYSSVSSVASTYRSQSIISTQASLPELSSLENVKKRKLPKPKRDVKAKRTRDGVIEDTDPCKSLSDQDRQMLERWTKMQKTTKPFVHPIRKHMPELMELKAQSVTHTETATTQEVISRSSADSVSGKAQVQFQFTNLVPVVKGGGVTLVKDTSKAEAPALGKVTATLSTGQKTILVPVGTIPCYRLQGPLKQPGPLVIVQPARSCTTRKLEPSTAVVNSNARATEGLVKSVPIAAVAPLHTEQSTVPEQEAVKSQSGEGATSKQKAVGRNDKTIFTNTLSNLQLVMIPAISTVSKVLSSRSTSNQEQTNRNDNSSSSLDSTNPFHHPSGVTTTTWAGNPLRTSPFVQLSSNEPASKVVSNKLEENGGNVIVTDRTSNASSESSPSPAKSVSQDHVTSTSLLSPSTSNFQADVTDDANLEGQIIAACELQGKVTVDGVDGNEELMTSVSRQLPLTPRENAILQIMEQFLSPKPTSSDNNRSDIENGSEARISDNAEEENVKCNGRDAVENHPEGYSLPCDTSEEKNEPNLTRTISDLLMMTPRTPKSGACGYGLGFDLEELLIQSGTAEFWQASPRTLESSSIQMSESIPPALSASLLNDWLDVRALEPSDMEELQKELESTSSLLHFDS